MVQPNIQYLTVSNPKPTSKMDMKSKAADSRVKRVLLPRNSLNMRIIQKKMSGIKKKSKSLTKSSLHFELLKKHIEEIRIKRIKLMLENEELRLSLSDIETENSAVKDKSENVVPNTGFQSIHPININSEEIKTIEWSSSRTDNPVGDFNLNSESSCNQNTSSLDLWMDEFFSSFKNSEPPCHAQNDDIPVTEDAFKHAEGMGSSVLHHSDHVTYEDFKKHKYLHEDDQQTQFSLHQPDLFNEEFVCNEADMFVCPVSEDTTELSITDDTNTIARHIGCEETVTSFDDPEFSDDDMDPLIDSILALPETWTFDDLYDDSGYDSLYSP